jgi:hypothetical protein
MTLLTAYSTKGTTSIGNLVRRSKNRPRNFDEIDRKWQIDAKDTQGEKPSGSP